MYMALLLFVKVWTQETTSLREKGCQFILIFGAIPALQETVKILKPTDRHQQTCSFRDGTTGGYDFTHLN